MRSRGFLIVLMLAAVIVAALYIVKTGGKSSIQTQVDQYIEAERDLTVVNLKTIENSVVAFVSSEGRTPADLRELQKFQPVATPNFDAWGREIRYERTSDSEFRLVSSGADGAFDTDDDIIREY